MIAPTLQLLDAAAEAVRGKDDSLQTFSRVSMYRFELKLQLTLTIARHELQLNQELSDATCAALSQLITFQCLEYYKYQYPAVYQLFSTLGLELQKYNTNYKNYEPKGIGPQRKAWVRYFKNTLTTLFE